MEVNGKERKHFDIYGHATEKFESTFILLNEQNEQNEQNMWTKTHSNKCFAINIFTDILLLLSTVCIVKFLYCILIQSRICDLQT